MTVPRKRFRPRIRRRKPTSPHMEEAARKAREEAKIVTRREREIARRAQVEASRQRAEKVAVWVKGAALETRRRLRPLGRMLAWIAPPITTALLFLVRIPAWLIAFLLGLTQGILRRLRAWIVPLVTGVGRWMLKEVTPVRTLAAVSAMAAVALGASQFAHYRGVAVGAPQYSGEVGTTAPAPLTELETAGSAHLYVLLALAVVALGLIWLTARGRWQLGRGIALVGIAGMVVSLLVDAPQGLDAGTAGVAYYGSEAELIEGFWAQLSASAALVLCGPLLGRYVKTASGEESPEAHRAAPLTAPRLGTDSLRTET